MLVRRNEHADTHLDGILRNPVRDVADVITDNANVSHLFAETVRSLCLPKNLGDPIVGSHPDHVQLENDPIDAGVVVDLYWPRGVDLRPFLT